MDAHCKAIEAILSHQMVVVFQRSTIDIDKQQSINSESSEAIQNLQAINQMNWQ